MISAARPLLQQVATASGAAGAPSGGHSDAAMHRQELKELDCCSPGVAYRAILVGLPC